MVTKKDFLSKDILSSEDYSPEQIELVLSLAEDIENNSEKFKNSLNGKIMAPLFFESSTRTTSSFQSAMLQLGGKVLDFDVDRSSVNKGETLTDTSKIIDGYSPDVVVIRHKKDGAAKLAADVISCPVINAGDGKNQHPTQTFLDLYSIKKITGKIEGVKLVLAGDLKYGRTVHSLSLALAKYPNCELIFVSPESLKMPKYLLDKLTKLNVKFIELGIEKLQEAIGKADILYMTRIQRERFPEGPEGEQQYQKVSSNYCLRLEMIENSGNSSIKVMHPLPKIEEIETQIDNTSNAYYFQQAKNGLFVRKALLFLVLGGEKDE